jgi:hypothetical protein
MTREYAEGLRDHKEAVFQDFQRLIPALDQAFPGYTIIVRPHPTENHAVYQEIAARCQRVRVTNEGNVVPWLMATRALIHNGCTTGVEAYAMGVPAISYRATINESYDYGFYRLPNLLSHQCFDFEALRQTLEKILTGQLGPADGAERQQLIDYHLAAQQGQLSCERMVDVLEEILQRRSELPRQGLRNRLHRWYITSGLRLAKRYKSRLPGQHHKPAFQRHRYPGISLEEIRQRSSRLQRLLGDNGELRIEQIFEDIFRITR